MNGLGQALRKRRGGPTASIPSRGELGRRRRIRRYRKRHNQTGGTGAPEIRHSL